MVPEYHADNDRMSCYWDRSDWWLVTFVLTFHLERSEIGASGVRTVAVLRGFIFFSPFVYCTQYAKLCGMNRKLC